MASSAPPSTAELRIKLIGKEGPPAVLEVEKGAIRSFAQAIGDTNPLWNDEAQARKTCHGGIIAPPTFLRGLRPVPPQQLQDLPYNRLLDGGSEWEYFEPVRPGDRITAVTRIIDVYDRSGRLGQMLFLITETSYTNQLQELVATQKNTSIRY